MVNAVLVKNKILEILKRRGPSLPIQLAKEVGISSLFVSAFLSELSTEKKIKISKLKVGGSPLYFMDGQVDQLEKFHSYMHPKESEAFLLLKKEKVLKDSSQDPAIRVALRSIKDFAVGFTDDNEIYWKHILIPNEEVELMFKSKPKIEDKIIEISNQGEENIINTDNKEELIEVTIKDSIKLEQVPEKIEIIEQVEPLKIIKDEIIKAPIQEIIQEKKLKTNPIKQIQKEIEFDNPLVEKIIEKPKKEKIKSDFVLNVISFLEKHHFKILEEKDHKSKEYLCIAELDSTLGPISFLTLAKDKKSVSDEDLKKLLSDSQRIPLPALYLAPGEMNKKAKEFQQKYYSILKFKKIT
ncbi:MAG: hypothetical protein WC867_08580 [Candidatus Pacearchaeota archaeon]|jgi:hypothetical protein